MAKQQLKITQCSLDSDNKTLKADSSKTFEAQINPSELSHGRSINYQNASAQGQTEAQPKFKDYGAQTLGFSLVFDGTGAVPAAGAAKTVSQRMQDLLGVVYQYVGDKHEPGYARIEWGTLTFDGRLASFSTKYSLFTPGGAPLRGKVDLSFTSYMTSTEAAATAAPQSPDLSREVLVREGDTLPLLCLRVYGDGRYYAEVARFNGLASFRALAPGARLRFPPLE